ncbi:MAG: 3-phosphoserine/phosphohydroxythreonine aminotransferase [SAR86 cluster bacterium BACL1 MAG-120828-bin5]|nr:MAG: 3-phosphoserine/phosphohydroxythreonine aminotransferase [SAR86 cluster bacterium BACL1 MAG-120828-bin5]KRP15370.1 MAG: 3-phosphoserine/phosphohydroxythreonine aminotransferase [SAR86 cluster bacterium BACL1 MAG-121128-bin56]
MRKWNFSAGPAAMPESVLEETQSELLEWKNSGMSIMEMSHRSPEYMQVASTARQDLIDLLGIPKNYQVLFLQGGATLQFSMIPMNFALQHQADYLLTGSWSKKALAEASKVATANIVASSETANFNHVPDADSWNESSDAAYFHYVANETIQGNALHQAPITQSPLIADMSSVILSEPIDVSQFSMIYAGAQKNIGPAGLTICIIKDEFLATASESLPEMLQYAKHAESESMLNTPPTFSWYLAGKVFSWLKENGGLEAIAKVNHAKATSLYEFIDASDFYSNPVIHENRSIMNVPFLLRDSDMDAQFLNDAQQAGLLNLKGHRSIGGMRASIYNATPLAAIEALTQFMREFELKHG